MSEINNLPPLVPQTITPPEVSLESVEVSSGDELSNSPFAQMFRGGATKEELRHFINNCLYAIIQECKRADAAAKRSSRRFLCSVTGRRYD